MKDSRPSVEQDYTSKCVITRALQAPRGTQYTMWVYHPGKKAVLGQLWFAPRRIVPTSLLNMDECLCRSPFSSNGGRFEGGQIAIVLLQRVCAIFQENLQQE